MIAVCLVMVVEPFAFLLPIGGQQGGVQVKEHVFGVSDGVYDLAHPFFDLIELCQGILVHAIPE